MDSFSETGPNAGSNSGSNIGSNTGSTTPADSAHLFLSPSDSTKGQSRAETDARGNRTSSRYLRLLREVSRISEQMDAEISAERMMKRALFLGYELEFVLGRSELRTAPESERLAALNAFFFEQKRFNVEADDLEAYRLDRLITCRSGAPLVLELLYAYLAETIGVDLDFVDLKPERGARFILRWNDSGAARFLDIARQGAWLGADQLIETLRSRVCGETRVLGDATLNACSAETYLSDYALALRDRLDRGHEPEKLLFLQDTLISYQPGCLQLVGERALLHRRLGNFKQSLADLKRYFAFNDRSRAPADLLLLHEELVEMLERGSAPV